MDYFNAEQKSDQNQFFTYTIKFWRLKGTQTYYFERLYIRAEIRKVIVFLRPLFCIENIPLFLFLATVVSVDCGRNPSFYFPKF